MWKQLNSKIIFEHPRLTLVEDEVQLPSGKTTTYLRFTGKHEGVMLVCKSADGKILIQQEYSYPPNIRMYEFPGGAADHGEDLVVAAKRELREEAGLEPENITKIGSFYVDNRRTNVQMHVFLVQGVRPVEKTGGDDEEDITTEWVTPDELSAMIARGQIVNYTMLAAWALYQNRKED